MDTLLLNNKLQNIIQGTWFILPEIILTALLVFQLIFDLITKSYRSLFWLTSISFALLFLYLTFFYNQQDFVLLSNIKTSGDTIVFYNGMLKIAPLILVFQILVLFSVLLFLFHLWFSTDTSIKKIGEVYYLLTGLVLGLFLLLKANNFMVMFMAVETVSITSYILISLAFNKPSSEAALKYILFGAITTSVSLFSLSLYYGIQGDLSFTFSNIDPKNITWYVVFLFLAISFLYFKLSLFPFHIWTPDIYQGGSISIVNLLSIAPKLATMGLLYVSFRPLLFHPQIGNYTLFLFASLAVLSMFIGNLGAIRQDNLKRLMAFSSIAQSGFIFSIFLLGQDFAQKTLLFYLFIYLIMNFLTFFMLDIIQNVSKSYDVNNFKGLGLHLPFFGVIFVICMVSLVGLPPTAGFTGKLYVFAGLWASFNNSENVVYLVLFVTALINTLPALYYYLRIPYYMFFKKANSEIYLTSMPVPVYIFIGVISFTLIILFFNPSLITEKIFG